jgi:glutamate--cysteine ligase
MGSPRFRLPDGGQLTFEPGGQVEYSSRAFSSATELLQALCSTITPLRAAALDAGMEWWSVGIDPVNPVERTPLQIRSDRYLRMTEYFERRGPAGTRMMRQTAAYHVNVDLDEDPIGRFRLLNAAAPYLIATFANSPLYAGADTGHRSYRSHVWRETDPARTGVLGGEDPAQTYLEFCLDAPAILKGPQDGAYLPFRAWVRSGEATMDDWRAHLLNVYPDVRPRGYLELRSPDAIPPELYVAPIALVAGIVYDPSSARAAADLLGEPDPARLLRAGEAGLREPEIAAVARDLFEIGLRGCAALGPEFLSAAHLEEARAFYERYTRRARSPGDELRPPAAG